MANKGTDLYLDPVGQGVCEIQGCSNPAKHRASWAQGVVVKLVCAGHKTEIEGKPFEELGRSMFKTTRGAVLY